MTNRFRPGRPPFDESVDHLTDRGEPSPATEDPPPAQPVTTAVSAPRSFAGRDDQSLVDEHSTFNGRYHSSRNLMVEGTVEGEITCDGRLTVAEQATVEAKVTAQDITVAGRIEGEIICRGLLEILPTGQVLGTVSTQRFAVHEGGFCNGTLTMEAADSETVVAETEDNDSAADDPESPTRIFRNPVRKVE